MRRFAAGLAALAVTACTSNPAPMAAQEPAPSAAPPTIEVSATATVKRTPDVAVVQLAVETLAETARAASERNATTMEAVLEAVRNQGVGGDAIRTQRLDLQPRYAGRRDGDPEIVGYRALNQVTIRLDDVTRAGPVVDAAVRAGANRVTGIRFEISDPESAYHEALRDAVAKATAEAEVVAAALGRSLGAPLRVSTGGGGPVPSPMVRMEAMAMDMAESMAPPVEPGDVEVRASVHIAWRLGS